MGLRSAERTGTARVAVLGAETPTGGQVRQALADRQIPGRRVDLYGRSGEEVVLSEYAGEARLIQDPDPEEIVGHDVVFLCERGEAAERVLAATGKAVVIDLAGMLDSRTPLVDLNLDGGIVQEPGGRIAVPHPLTMVLADLLQPLDGKHAVRRVSAVVLRPAADFGEPGIEELRDQTVRLLNFMELPKEVFGTQLAFNVIPETALDPVEPGLETRVAAEVGRLLGWDEPRIGLRLITVPVFHGHAAMLHVGFERATGPDEALATLEQAGTLELPSETCPRTPLEATGNRRTSVLFPQEDGMGGLWIWALAGEAAASAADRAVRLAGKVVDL